MCVIYLCVKFIIGSAISDVEAQEHYDRFFEVGKISN